MGGKSKSTQTQVSNQQTSYGSTPAALAGLPAFQQATQTALNTGPYMGDVVAAPAAQANYVAGLTPESLAAIADGNNWVGSTGGQVQDTSKALLDYWGAVAHGDYLDPNNNAALQNYLATFNDSNQQQFARSQTALKNQAVEAGALGDTNYNRAALWDQDQFTQNTQATLAQVLLANYEAERARMGQAAQGTSDAFSLGLDPARAGDALGERLRQGEQYKLDNAAAVANAQAAERQAQLSNDAYRAEAGSSYEMDTWAKYFQTLANPVFGTNSNGTSTTEVTRKTPLWKDILGAASGIAGIAAGPAGGLFSSMAKTAIPAATSSFTPTVPFSFAPTPMGLQSSAIPSYSFGR